MSKSPPNRVQAKALAEAHEQAATVMREYARGLCSVKELSKRYSKITASVQRELTATEGWRLAVNRGEVIDE